MGKPKVLVVDDDPVVKNMVVRLMSGFVDVREASGGAEALKLVRKARSEGSPFELVLSDVDMPSVDGPGLLSSCVRDGVLLPVNFVFMSGSRTGEAARRLLEDGLLVVAKPFDGDELVAAVEARLSDLALTRFRKVATVAG